MKWLLVLISLALLLLACDVPTDGDNPGPVYADLTFTNHIVNNITFIWYQGPDGPRVQWHEMDLKSDPLGVGESITVTAEVGGYDLYAHGQTFEYQRLGIDVTEDGYTWEITRDDMVE